MSIRKFQPRLLDSAEQGRPDCERRGAIYVSLGFKAIQVATRTGKYFQGRLDDVRIWNTVRLPDEIAAHYQQQLPNAPSGLVANWRFDEPAGNRALDSAAAHEASLSGGATFVSLVHP